jgi:hypothetical protein
MKQSGFESLMNRARALCSGDYLAGYQRGLRRYYHGEKFGTQAEHEKFLNPGEHRAELGRGYRDGFAGKPPAVKIPE